ncbi:MAG TPA: Abi-alpha family protein [Chthoniobacteraceae bacterium]|nr:Abi-alpha family protein [Chthoniobacteraceae bacterium]
MIAAAGADIHEIPPRTLIPILEGASIEDNAELAELWAALLANAATSEEDVIPPILPSILQQLTPFDAHIFARVHALQVELQTRERDVGPEGELPRWGVRRSEIGLVDADSERLESAINTLTALGLIEREPVMRFDNGQIFASDSDELRLSALGRRFLNACTPPSSGDVRAS